MRAAVALVGGAASAPLAAALAGAGVEVLAIANTGDDREGARPDIEALAAVTGVDVVPVTEDPNSTTVVLAGRGEVPAHEWVAEGRPGRLLAVRMPGRPSPAPGLPARLARAGGTVVGPDDPDLVIDPVLKVLGQGGVRLPRPVVAVGHHHGRFAGFATREVAHPPRDPVELAAAVVAALTDGPSAARPETLETEETP